MRFVGEGADKLRKLVGKRTLRGRMVVDQVYARYQHERLDLKHPRGGHPKYLWLSLVIHKDEYLKALADNILVGGAVDAMKRVVENQDGKLHRYAPVLFNNLRESGNPQVFDDGAKVYDRAARQPRMTREQLKAQRRNRGGGFGAGGLGGVT